MSTEIQQREVRQLNVTEAKDIAEFYNLPQSLVNMMWCNFAGVAYPKEPFLLKMAADKGYQAMKLVAIKEGPEEWEFECQVYPVVTSRMMEALAKIPDANERARYWEYLTQPTSDRGKASKANVRMPQMHEWLREIAVKRAVARACRLYSGFGNTAYEELPDAELSREELEEARTLAERAKRVGKSRPSEGRLD